MNIFLLGGLFLFLVLLVVLVGLDCLMDLIREKIILNFVVEMVYFLFWNFMKLGLGGLKFCLILVVG